MSSPLSVSPLHIWSNWRTREQIYDLRCLLYKSLYPLISHLDYNTNGAKYETRGHLPVNLNTPSTSVQMLYSKRANVFWWCHCLTRTRSRIHASYSEDRCVLSRSVSTNLYFQIKADGCEFLSLNLRAFMSELQRQRLQRGCHGFETLFRASRDIIKGHAK